MDRTSVRRSGWPGLLVASLPIALLSVAIFTPCGGTSSHILSRTDPPAPADPGWLDSSPVPSAALRSPWVGLGISHRGNSQPTLLAPFAWTERVVPPAEAFWLSASLRCLAAAVGTFWLARSLASSFSGGLIAAASFSTCALLIHDDLPAAASVAALLPLLLLAARWIPEWPRRGMLLLIVTLFLAVQTGDVASTTLSLVLAFAFLLGEWRRLPAGDRAAVIMRFVGAALVAAFLSAPVVLPWVEDHFETSPPRTPPPASASAFGLLLVLAAAIVCLSLARSHRRRLRELGVDPRRSALLRRGDWLLAFLAGTFWVLYLQLAEGARSGPLPGWLGIGLPGELDRWSSTGAGLRAVGATTLLLASAATFLSPRPLRRLSFLLWACCLISLRLPPLETAFRLLLPSPSFEPGFLAIGAALFAALLAGQCLDLLRSAVAGAGLRRRLLWFAIPAALVLGYLLPASESWSPVGLAWTGIGALLLTTSCRERRTRVGRAAGLLLTLAVVLEGAFSFSRSLADPPLPAAAVVPAARTGSPRIPRLLTPPGRFPAPALQRLGWASVPGDRRRIQPGAAALFAALNRRTTELSQVLEVDPTHPLFALLGVEAMLVPAGRSGTAPEVVRPERTAEPWRLLRPTVAPLRQRFYADREVVLRPEDAPALENLRSLDTLLLEGPIDGWPGALPETPPGAAVAATWVRGEYDEVRFEVAAGPAGFLLVTDLYSRHFTAHSNGAPARVVKAFGALVAVRLPAAEGPRFVSLEYLPWTAELARSMFVGGLALLPLLFYLGLPLRRSASRQPLGKAEERER